MDPWKDTKNQFIKERSYSNVKYVTKDLLVMETWKGICLVFMKKFIQQLPKQNQCYLKTAQSKFSQLCFSSDKVNASLSFSKL